MCLGSETTSRYPPLEKGPSLAWPRGKCATAQETWEKGGSPRKFTSFSLIPPPDSSWRAVVAVSISCAAWRSSTLPCASANSNSNRVPCSLLQGLPCTSLYLLSSIVQPAGRRLRRLFCVARTWTRDGCAHGPGGQCGGAWSGGSSTGAWLSCRWLPPRRSGLPHPQRSCVWVRAGAGLHHRPGGWSVRL